MKAVVYATYGPPEVWRIAEVPQPAASANEVLIKIHSSAITRTDCETRDVNRRAGPLVSALSRLVSGVRRPRQPILGKDFAGVVEEVGSEVREFKPGDRVFGSTGFRFGTFAEFIALPETARITQMPASITFDEAAAICDGGLYALWPLKLARIQDGEAVLIYGASGAIGTAAVQLAKSFGAEVTAVCNTKNFGLMAELGADHSIDYTREDFTKNGRKYDVIMDAVAKTSYARSMNSLKPGGRFLATDHLGNLFLHFWTARVGKTRVIFSIPPRASKQDVRMFKSLIESGKYRAVIDRTYPMGQVVAAARYVETEQKTGNVILRIASPNAPKLATDLP
jgi:NADPH:quinone reductase-like Zn-dependent oxidoreductase